MPKQKSKSKKESPVPVGIIGLGLMGTSITTCLVAAGHPAVCIDKEPERRKSLKRRVLALLREMRREKLLAKDPAGVVKNITVTEDFGALRDCGLVIEAIFEDFDAKREVLRKAENAIAPGALIGTNTSALPVSELQRGAQHPERILGIHWAEPAHITRFLEVICGNQTDIRNGEKVLEMARRWNKEPTLVRRDIRGFITNRLMYAMLREAFHLVENGYATPADVDRSIRNDMGYWMTFAGPFRFMDVTGIPAYQAVMRDLLPELSNNTAVPKLMQDVVASGALGTQNAKGFYSYTPAQAKRWEKRFLEFTYDIRVLALKYAERPGD
ncbi:MAG TPA: 3-hydroxyacyl-CoA dehydrogenase family protein [Bryobacteraceae bacterium]|nr:3-hydroxyacyl-CoA dehydrogenase family protein [Bryobacteraceae bacterium]